MLVGGAAMRYSTGSAGRVFAVKLEHGDNFYESLEMFVKTENVRNGYVFFLGALEEGRMVTNPKDLTLPTSPEWGSFSDGREVLGMGSIMWKEDDPGIHIHAIAGRRNDQLMGCIRAGGRVHIVIEAVVIEVNFPAELKRALDMETGAYLPDHK